MSKVRSTVAMADEGEKRRRRGKESLSSGEWERTLSRVVQGVQQGSSWMSHRLSAEELEQLQAFSSKILELPEAGLEEAYME